ncbi:MAG: DNA polymerase III subunit gamma/tau [Saccharofermentans sp.]|nr:DNA polymerase III subunit gamma/tau [Saccharofermentans sp.]
MDQEHIALYRKFRPQTFDEITSQDAAVTALKQAVKTGKIGHAYMFAGQRGTGKTTIAKVFSRAINCTDPKDGNPCNECDICKSIAAGSLLDVIEIDAASNNGVENVRRICDEAVFAPSKAKYKVYIIDEVHMLSTGAYNALLKTLEEPPAHVVFLFATTEPHKILPTILSRCQKYYFKRIPNELIVKRLRYICDKENIKAEDDALKQIAALSDGALRDAISLLDQAAGAAFGEEITTKSVHEIAGTADTSVILETGDVLIDGNYEALLRLCAKISESGRDYVRFVLDLAEYFRDLLVIRTVPDPTDLVNYSPADMKKLYMTASKVNPDTLIGFISYMAKLASDLKTSPSVSASFETGLIRICGRKTSLPVTPLVIPDFEKKQANAAKILSGEKPAEEEKPKEEKETPEETVKETFKTAEEPKKEELKKDGPEKDEPKKEEKPLFMFTTREFSEEVAENTEIAVEDRTESKSEDKKNENEDRKEQEMNSLADRLAQLRASLGKHSEEDGKKDEEKKKETKKEPDSSAKGLFVIDEPIKEEKVKIDDADDEKPAKTEKNDNTEDRQIGIPGLSDSFVDDIKIKEEPKKNNGKTSLSTVYDKSGLIVSNPHSSSVRQPEFKSSTPGNISQWQMLLNELGDTNPNLYSTLNKAEFKTIEDNGYIVFDDNYKNVVENLKGLNEFRRLAQTIKSSFEGVGRLFVCTNTQFNNALVQNEKRKKEQAAEEMKAKARQMGVNMDIHFGDD